MSWSRWWLPLLICAWGCAGPASGADGGADPAVARVELGQGELEFSPLSDQEALPYTAGAQGGHHVFVSFRVQQLQPSRMHVSVTTAVLDHPELVLTREGRVNFASAPAPAAAADESTQQFEFAGWPAQILLAPCHVGELAQIDVTLTDLDMRSASDSRIIRIAMPDSAPEPKCPAR